MPRAERLSSRLDTLLDAVFDSTIGSVLAVLGNRRPAPPRPARAGPEKDQEDAAAERGDRRRIRRSRCLRPAPDGFPAHRILHFLSLYVPGGIRLSLFELAVSAIFLGEPPIPASLLYDLTQYTYLEKRLLVRKSMEISDDAEGLAEPRGAPLPVPPVAPR